MKVAKQMFYGAVGAGDLALEKVRKLDVSKLKEIRMTDLRKIEKAGFSAWDSGVKMYSDLANRGETRVAKIRRAAPTQRAVAQVKTARTQSKAAVTSAKKAVESTVDAVEKAVSAQ